MDFDVFAPMTHIQKQISLGPRLINNLYTVGICK
jgi:hypothetical protein